MSRAGVPFSGSGVYRCKAHRPVSNQNKNSGPSTHSEDPCCESKRFPRTKEWSMDCQLVWLLCHTDTSLGVTCFVDPAIEGLRISACSPLSMRLLCHESQNTADVGACNLTSLKSLKVCGSGLVGFILRCGGSLNYGCSR